MIAHLRGTLLTKHPNQVVVETAGVGYEVNISVPTFSELPANGSEVALHIHTHVREDVIALYGFLRPPEKALFEKLMTVSGIGAKRAILRFRSLLSDAERAEDQVEYVVGGSGAGNGIERPKSAVEIEQQHFVRDSALHRADGGIERRE